MYTNAICAARLEKDALELLGVRRFEHDVAAACARCPLVKVARSRARTVKPLYFLITVVKTAIRVTRNFFICSIVLLVIMFAPANSPQVGT